MQEVFWYSVCGEKMNDGKMHYVEWTRMFNFLNPDNETLCELWENGEESFCRRHERFALVGWRLPLT